MSTTHIVLVIFVYSQHSIIQLANQNDSPRKLKRKYSIKMEFMSNDWMTAKHSTGVSIIESNRCFDVLMPQNSSR